MDYAIFLLITACIAVGCTAAVVTTWRLRARLFSLEELTTRLEGSLLREVKARAGAERWKRPSADEEFLKAALAPTTKPKPRYNFWETAVAMRQTQNKG